MNPSQKTIRALVVDDEAAGRKLIRSMLGECCSNVSIVGEADNLTNALEIIRAKKPQLVFLDIEMPGGDGFELLDRLDEIDFQIIFVTAYNEYAIKAIKYAALDFILKPINVKELARAIAISQDRIYHEQQFKVLQQQFKDSREQERIILPGHNSQLVVPLDDIIKIKASHNYVIFYFEDGSEFLASHNLQHYCDLLPQSLFFRIHRSCLINMKKVREYDRGSGGMVHLSDGSSESIATRRKPDFIKSLRLV